MSMSNTPSAAPRHRLAQAVLGALAASTGVAMAAPATVEFDPSYLAGAGAQAIDLSRFEQGDALLPGRYRADIQVNGAWVGRRDIRFASEGEGKGATRLCLSRELLAEFGVDFEQLEKHLRQQGDEAATLTPVPVLPEGEFCEDIGVYLPDASTRFDSGELRLDVSIPQMYLARDARGWVHPSQWDQGVTAARIGYSFSHQQSRVEGRDTASTWLGLNASLNVGAWRLYHNGGYRRSTSDGSRYTANNTYVQRDLTGMRAQLTVGESATQGDLFPSIGFRGVSIASDDRMLPDSMQGYAPVVRGTAQSNARVTIRQRGQVIYETTVAPGPFEIDDLYGTSYGGDLEVAVIEADGSTQTFIVPFAAVPQLLREGQRRFGLTAGEVRETSLRKAPAMLEATWRHGLSNTFTGYGGATLADGYGALLFGGAYNTRWGAFAGDITASRTTLPGGIQTETEEFGSTLSGQSARLTYSNHLAESGTNFSLAAYRYSTDGYLSLAEGMRLRESLAAGAGLDELPRQRTRLDLNISQTLGEGRGSLYVVGSSSRYWNRAQESTSFNLGYNNSFRRASYSLSAQRTRVSYVGVGGITDPSGRLDTSVNFQVTLPLGQAPRAPNLTTSYTHRNNGRDNTRLGVTGTVGQERAVSYGASVGHTDGQATNVNGNLGYRTPVVDLAAGYSRTGDSQSLSLGASGGIVVHPQGIHFSQQMGETIGILHVPGAANARVGSSTGLRTNRNGYAVVPYLTPYRFNEVTIDPKGLPLDLELKSTAVKTAPRAGAVVQLAIQTDTARSALIQALREDGQPLPFGVDVYDEAGQVVGVVGQASRLWVRGVQERGALFVSWGPQPADHCRIDYDLAEQAQPDHAGVPLLQVPCRDPSVHVSSPNDGKSDKGG